MDCPITEFKIDSSDLITNSLPSYVSRVSSGTIALFYTKGPTYFYDTVQRPLQSMKLAYGMPCAFSDEQSYLLDKTAPKQEFYPLERYSMEATCQDYYPDTDVTPISKDDDTAVDQRYFNLTKDFGNPSEYAI